MPPSNFVQGSEAMKNVDRRALTGHSPPANTQSYYPPHTHPHPHPQKMTPRLVILADCPHQAAARRLAHESHTGGGTEEENRFGTLRRRHNRPRQVKQRVEALWWLVKKMRRSEWNKRVALRFAQPRRGDPRNRRRTAVASAGESDEMPGSTSLSPTVYPIVRVMSSSV